MTKRVEIFRKNAQYICHFPYLEVWYSHGGTRASLCADGLLLVFRYDKFCFYEQKYTKLMIKIFRCHDSHHDNRNSFRPTSYFQKFLEMYGSFRKIQRKVIVSAKFCQRYKVILKNSGLCCMTKFSIDLSSWDLNP